MINQSTKKNIVLIPGLNNTAEIWNGVVDQLKDEFNCYPVTCPAIDDVDALAKDLLETLPASFYLCGFSFGGFVALSMLAQAPERIEGLTLMATSATADTEVRKQGRMKAIERAEAGEYEQMINGQAGKIFYQENAEKQELKDLRKKMLDEYGADRFIAHQKASMDRPDRYQELSKFEGPVLIVAASDDQVFPPSTMLQLSEDIKGADFKEIPRSGHMLPMEEPQEVAACLRSWMMS